MKKINIENLNKKELKVLSTAVSRKLQEIENKEQEEEKENYSELFNFVKVKASSLKKFLDKDHIIIYISDGYKQVITDISIVENKTRKEIIIQSHEYSYLLSYDGIYGEDFQEDNSIKKLEKVFSKFKVYQIITEFF